DEGLNFYSNGLLASDKMIQDNPELVQAMVAATSEAFAAAAENPAEAVQAMSGKDPQIPSDSVLENQWNETIKLLSTDATANDVPGTNAVSDWENTIEVLAGAGL